MWVKEGIEVTEKNRNEVRQKLLEPIKKIRGNAGLVIAVIPFLFGLFLAMWYATFGNFENANSWLFVTIVSLLSVSFVVALGFYVKAMYGITSVKNIATTELDEIVRADAIKLLKADRRSRGLPIL